MLIETKQIQEDINFFIDDINVSGIETNDKEVEDIIKNKLPKNHRFDDCKFKFPDVIKYHQEFKETQVNVDILMNVLKLCKKLKIERIKIRLDNDYPLLITTDRFLYVQAPIMSD